MEHAALLMLFGSGALMVWRMCCSGNYCQVGPAPIACRSGVTSALKPLSLCVAKGTPLNTISNCCIMTSTCNTASILCFKFGDHRPKIITQYNNQLYRYSENVIILSTGC